MPLPKGFVSVEALCLRPGDASPAVHTIEEFVPLGPILSAKTLNDALEYFLSKTDIVAEIEEVRSFKVNGRELLPTFEI